MEQGRGRHKEKEDTTTIILQVTHAPNHLHYENLQLQTKQAWYFNGLEKTEGVRTTGSWKESINSYMAQKGCIHLLSPNGGYSSPSSFPSCYNDTLVNTSCYFREWEGKIFPLFLVVLFGDVAFLSPILSPLLPFFPSNDGWGKSTKDSGWKKRGYLPFFSFPTIRISTFIFYSTLFNPSSLLLVQLQNHPSISFSHSFRFFH